MRQPSLKRRDEQRRHIAAGLIADFLKARGAGDVDLGERVADDVQAHQQQAARGQHRAQGLGDLAVARRDGLRHALAPSRQIAAHLAALWDACQAIGHHLAVDQQHPFVAVHDRRQVALDHDGAPTQVGQRLDDGAQVEAVGPHPEDAAAAHAIERFEDDVLVLGMKGPDVGLVLRHQRGRGELRKFHDGQFLGVVAQGARRVEDPRPFALGLAQQVGGVEVLAVKRRVLAHDHRVGVGQRPGARVHHLEPVVGAAGQADLARVRGDGRAALPAHPMHLAGQHAVAASLRLAHHGKGGVLVGFEGLKRIGNKHQLHAPNVAQNRRACRAG